MTNTGNKVYTWLEEAIDPPTSVSDYTISTSSTITETFYSIKINSIDYLIQIVTTGPAQDIEDALNALLLGVFTVTISLGTLTITTLENENSVESINLQGFLSGDFPFDVSNTHDVVDLTGNRKLNLETDPDYIPPVIDYDACPTFISSTSVSTNELIIVKFNT